MEFLIPITILFIVLIVLVIYTMVMIGIMANKTTVANNIEKDISERRAAVKTKYNVA